MIHILNPRAIFDRVDLFFHIQCESAFLIHKLLALVNLSVAVQIDVPNAVLILYSSFLQTGQKTVVKTVPRAYCRIEPQSRAEHTGRDRVVAEFGVYLM